jgi:PKD-like domain/Secretion system C-terminal sorting domain
MKKTLLLLGCFITFTLFAQTPEFEWALQQGGQGGENGRAIVSDNWGNIYVTGSFSDTVDFDPGPDEYTLIAEGSRDLFVSKMNPTGQLLWAQSIGGYGDFSLGRAISLDTAGNVYVTGEFQGTIDFDFGSGVHYLSSATDELSDVFILKIDTDGNYIWAKGFGAGGDDVPYGIAVDVMSNTYVTGVFLYQVDFNPEPGNANIYYLSSNGSRDAFVLKLNSEGDFVWAKAFGGEGNVDNGWGISLDTFNNVLITGSFNETVDFDPGSDQFFISAQGVSDVFILKLSNNGDFVWVKDIGGILGNIYSHDVMVDEDGHVYAIGSFDGTVDFDPGPDVYDLSSTVSIDNDIFIFKLNDDGLFIWAKRVGDGRDDSWAGTIDQSNYIYLTGTFDGTVDFDPGSSVYELVATMRDAYKLKLNTEGEFVWAGSLTGSGDILPYSIVLDNWDNIYTTGFFWETSDFDPGNEVYELTSNGYTDIFIHKMRQEPCIAIPVISISIDSFAICPEDSLTLTVELPTDITGFSYSWNTGAITKSIIVAPDTNTIYTVGVYHSPACYNAVSVEIIVFDSVAISITEDTTICEAEEIWLEASGGTSYQWSTGDMTSAISITGQEDKSYSVTVTDINGCSGVDSVFVFVNPSSDTTLLEFITCDSMAAGIFEFAYENQSGCDSIVIETAILLLVPEIPAAPADLVILENEPPFQVSIPEVANASSYFWTVPVGVQILSGAGTNTITIDWGGLTTGGFVCVSAINDCGSSAESCMEVTVDIMDAIKGITIKSYSIFPNPADDVLNIIFSDSKNYEISFFDVLGREALSPASYVGKAQIITRNLPSGIYWLKINKDGKLFWERIELIR